MGRKKKEAPVTPEVMETLIEKTEKHEKREKLEPPKVVYKVFPPKPPAKGGEVVIKPWGSYVVLDEGPSWKTKCITISPGQRFSEQSHKLREEVWVVVEGTGDFIFNGDVGKARSVIPGDAAFVYKGMIHRARCTSETPLVFIEIQRGECLESDIQRYADDYGRTSNS